MLTNLFQICEYATRKKTAISASFLAGLREFSTQVIQHMESYVENTNGGVGLQIEAQERKNNLRELIVSTCKKNSLKILKFRNHFKLSAN